MKTTRKASSAFIRTPNGWFASRTGSLTTTLPALEIHHSTDEQFILAAGKAILITAEREGGSFKNIELTPMQQGKVYNVPAECWFYSITQKDTKVIYVQDSNCSMENSDLADLTAAQIADIQERARKILAE